jgi:hypothetical protein
MTYVDTGQARGLKYQADVPKDGWECVRVESLVGHRELCQWCDLRRIQHVYVMRHPIWPTQVRAGGKCAADISDPFAASSVPYDLDDEQLDDSAEANTEILPLQTIAEQRRWNFTRHLLVASVIALLVVLFLIFYG